MYVKLMSDWDAITPDQFDDRVEDLVDEIEGQEIRLTKQKIIFDVTEQDQTYYQSLTNKTNNEIDNAKKQIQLLEKQLKHEKLLKSYKKQFEEAATSINEFPPAQESMTKIKECEVERDRLEKACKNEFILLSMHIFSKLWGYHQSLGRFDNDGKNEMCNKEKCTCTCWSAKSIRTPRI